MVEVGGAPKGVDTIVGETVVTDLGFEKSDTQRC